MVWVVLYVATIFAANWAIAAFGAVPVGFGLMALAGLISPISCPIDTFLTRDCKLRNTVYA